MNLNNLKIGQRLALGFGALLALTALMFGAAFVLLISNAQSSKAADEYDRRASLAAQWTAHTELNVTRTLAIAKATGMPQVEAHFGPLMKETSAKISEIQKELETAITSEKGKALMAEVGEKRKVYLDLRKELMALVKNADPLAAETLLNAKVMPASQAYLGAMRNLLSLENELSDKQAQEVVDGLARGKLILGVLLLAALCHDLGKPATTATAADGRIRSLGHAQAGLEVLVAVVGVVGVVGAIVVAHGRGSWNDSARRAATGAGRHKLPAPEPPPTGRAASTTNRPHGESESMSFLISDAYAQAAPAGAASDPIMQFLPLVVIMVAFYFILLRPQQKRQKEHKSMIEALKKGDEVVTGGGVLGRIVEVGDNFVSLEVADKVEIKVQKAAVSSLLPKGTVKGL